MNPDLPLFLVPYVRSFEYQPALFFCVFFSSVLGVMLSIRNVFIGLANLSMRRQLEDLPTSKIQSMALGTVELKGRVANWNLAYALFSGLDAAYYNSSVWHWQADETGALSWVRMAGQTSGLQLFCIEDETGRALIAPAETALELSLNYDILTGFFRPIPPHLKRFLNERSIPRYFFIFPLRFRFRETRLALGDNCYVVGECRDNRRLDPEHQQLCPALQEMNSKDIADKKDWGIKEDAAKFDVYIGKCSDGVHKYLITNRTEEQITKNLASFGCFFRALLFLPVSLLLLLYLPKAVWALSKWVEFFGGTPVSSGG